MMVKDVVVLKEAVDDLEDGRWALGTIFGTV